MLHTVHPMAFEGRDIQGDSIFERGLLGIGDGIGLLAGVVLAVSAFTGWYAGPGDGVKVSVTGWDTGVAGKIVFFLGVAVVLVVVLRDEELETIADAMPERPADVTRAVTAAALIRDRRLVLTRLQHLGVHVIESEYDRVGERLVAGYIDLKRRNLL